MILGSAPHLFCFGLGFSARVLALRLLREGWTVSGTCRDRANQDWLQSQGIRTHLFDRQRPVVDGAGALESVTDILSSVPPDGAGDTVLDLSGDTIARHKNLRWIGYLSTTGVYGDTGGAVVDETAPLNPNSERSRRRVDAERRWLRLRDDRSLPVHVFRLAGIYGPGRSTLDQVRAGQARRIDKPGHVFGRIHVDDIATVLRASMARPDPGRIYNLCDDLPAPPADVVSFACDLLGERPPPIVSLEEAAPTMSAMALSFWQDNRRVANERIKRELGVRLRYPDYRAGLRAILEVETAARDRTDEVIAGRIPVAANDAGPRPRPTP
jgi:nucleoside-diphosphate-sugar epimerase